VKALPHYNIKPENVLLFRRSLSQNNDCCNNFDIKLFDCVFAGVFSKLGKFTTEKNPIYYITPPNTLNGKKNLRIQRNYTELNFYSLKAIDIYTLGVVLVLIVKGNIEKKIVRISERNRKNRRKFSGCRWNLCHILC
jgi:serine/threonine protein kinase